MSTFASLRRFRAIIIKEYKHVWFDPGFLFLTLFSPAVLLMLLAYIFSFDVDQAKLALLDQDQTPQSRAYIQSLTADGDIRILAQAGGYDEVVSLFRAGSVDGALIIPPGFGSALEARQVARVNFVVDGAEPTSAIQIIASIDQRSGAFSRQALGVRGAPFDVRARVWFNANLDSQYSMVPGLMALVLIMPAMAVALGVTREKETGTFETLSTTPIRGWEYLLGKLVVYLSLGLVGTLLALGVAVGWFRVPFRGSLAVYLLLTGVYLFALMSISLVIAHIAPSQRTATSIVLLVFFIPSFFLTGLTFPVDDSSLASYLMAQSLPGTHFIIISRGVALKALGVSALARESLILLAMGGAASLLSILLFRKKLR